MSQLESQFYDRTEEFQRLSGVIRTHEKNENEVVSEFIKSAQRLVRGAGNTHRCFVLYFVLDIYRHGLHEDATFDVVPCLSHAPNGQVSQCESLEAGIRHFISMVDSLDLLLCGSTIDIQGGTSNPKKQREGFTYHELM